MLKSFSTQLAATAFFGPIGLAYTSMATAVLFTLILAVLYFTGFGVLAILVIWPVSIVTGVLYVKFHNDRIRQSGNRLLLGPGDEDGLVSAVGSWVRGVAVLALICAAGYMAYIVLPGGDQASVPGRIVDASSAGSLASGDVQSTTQSDTNTITRSTGDTNVIASTDSGTDSSTVITLPSREIPTVVVESDGSSTTTSQAGLGESGVGESTAISQPVLYVDREVVNLRQGPGTEYAIVTQLDRNESLVEFARDGVWVNVETESGSYVGWIHGNLIRR
jgi:hypothetical protein